MDTFDATAASLASFENGGDPNSFVDFFQQQQDQQGSQQQHRQQQSHPQQQDSNAFALPFGANFAQQQPGKAQNQQSSTDSAAFSAHQEIASPTSSLLRSSTSPSSRSQILAAGGMQTDSASTTVDSPNSTHFGGVPSSGSASSVAASAALGNNKAGQQGISSPLLHPNAATPVRHNSLPFEQQQHITSAGRPIAGSASRQMSMGALPGGGVGSVPASPHMNAMRPPPAMSHMSMGGQDNGAVSSPTGSDFLNPNSSISQSPSPLRSSMPFTTSPDHSTTTSPTLIKHEDSFSQDQQGGSSPNRSQTIPSPSMRTPGAAGSSKARANSQSGAGGPGSNEKNDANNPASSTKFVHKLFRMVSDPEYQHLISWNASGTSVVVTNFDEFSKEVLGKHFKHSNFSSFIRQLNMYGFYKVNKTPRGHRHAIDTQVWEFSHPKFIRGRHDLLDEIRRKALDSEHARVEARDLHYNVSVGHMQLRQQVDEHQYRLEEMFETNLALRQMVVGLRDQLASVLEWVQVNNGGQLPFENRLPMAELPPTPMMHPFMAERPPPGMYYSPNPAASAAAAAAAAAGGPNAAMMGQHDMMGGDGPSIFVTEPGFGQGPSPQHDVFSMHDMGQVSPMASRRPSSGSQAGERMDMHARSDGHGGPRISIDTSLAAAHNAAVMGMGNPGLGVMGLTGNLNGEMQMAINTPLPPSPAVPQHHSMTANGQTSPYATMENSPYLATSPSMPTFASQGYFGHVPAGMPPQQQLQQQHHFAQMAAAQNGGMMSEDDGSMLGPNAKSVRTQLKRTASNSGSQQMMMDAAVATMNVSQQQQKRKSPGV